MRIFLAACATAFALLSATSTTAQIYWLAPDLSGPPLTGYEAGMGVPLPGATTLEQNAAIVWNMRSGLNVAALQCGFEPTLRTLENYNAMLSDHKDEMAKAFNTLTAYFKRTSKTPKAGQSALDTFGTRTYSGFSTVKTQLIFCTAAGHVGRIGLFTPKGQFGTFATEHLRELRNSLTAKGEQQFRAVRPASPISMPRMDERCWKKGKNYDQRCGFDTIR
jgi:hypothetical protein